MDYFLYRMRFRKGEDWHKISHIPDLSIQAPLWWEVSGHDDDDEDVDEDGDDEINER
ncbi:hypothetical protein HanPSC8_Chr01g0041271 [Helianthus annuus]|nr:hypothetical protein HanPSC8_Chr01g0041271 [Helianthus annuus]